jgi:hypothetical protein
MWDTRAYMMGLEPSNKKKRISEIKTRQKRREEILGGFAVRADPAMGFIGLGNSKKRGYFRQAR